MLDMDGMVKLVSDIILLNDKILKIENSYLKLGEGG